MRSMQHVMDMGLIEPMLVTLPNRGPPQRRQWREGSWQWMRAEFKPSVSFVSASMGSLDNVPTKSVFDAINDQRLSLLNVLDIVHCIGVGVTSADANPAPEISAAFELLEREIQRVAAALEKLSLRSV
jgi:hypothetical protein